MLHAAAMNSPACQSRQRDALLAAACVVAFAAVPAQSGTACAAAPAGSGTTIAAAPAGVGGAIDTQARYVAVPAGALRSALANDADPGPSPVAAFAMRETPVTRGEFLQFVADHPKWRRSAAPVALAAAGYLRDWSSDSEAGGDAARPVTGVSWFAAEAFCQSEQARLPTWSEWEYVAAADEQRADARADPAWLERILGWYARPADAPLPAVGGSANWYGIRDLHGVVWEWVDDFNALLVDSDSRSGEDPDRLRFCGAGAINLQDRLNYAVLMRIALLSSLQAADSTGSLGFRCVRPGTEH